MKKILFLVVLVLVAFGVTVVAAPPFDRTISWVQSRTDTLGVAIPTGDSLITHIFVCDSGTDNTTCADIGTSASNALSWNGASTQPSNSTKYYRLRTAWIQQNSSSAFSPATGFTLPGRATTPAGGPAVQ